MSLKRNNKQTFQGNLQKTNLFRVDFSTRSMEKILTTIIGDVSVSTAGYINAFFVKKASASNLLKTIGFDLPQEIYPSNFFGVVADALDFMIPQRHMDL